MMIAGMVMHHTRANGSQYRSKSAKIYVAVRKSTASHLCDGVLLASRWEQFCSLSIDPIQCTKLAKRWGPWSRSRTYPIANEQKKNYDDRNKNTVSDVAT